MKCWVAGFVSVDTSLRVASLRSGSFLATRMVANAIRATLAKRERRREAGTILL
jgi:hypothetical protein